MSIICQNFENADLLFKHYIVIINQSQIQVHMWIHCWDLNGQHSAWSCRQFLAVL